jgi:hypothetical protein
MKYTIYGPNEKEKVSFVEDSMEDAIDHIFLKFPLLDMLWKSDEDARINSLGIIGISYHEDEVAEIEVRLPLGAKITYRVVGTEL